MKRKYKLLKELPQCPIGTILQVDSSGEYTWVHAAGTGFQLPIKVLEDYPEWFEEVSELPKSWEDLDKVPGYFLRSGGEIGAVSDYTMEIAEGAMSKLKYVFATEAQAKSAIAFAQLSQLAKVMNDGHGFEQACQKYYVTIGSSINKKDELQILWTYVKKQLPFKTKELAEFSLKHHRELWEDYWMISK